MKICVNLENIAKNADIIRSRLNSGVKLCAVVKANAYGHGLAQVAQYIENKVDFFAVARLDEALTLRSVGVKKAVLVLCSDVGRREAREAAARDITLTADSAETAELAAAEGFSVHIKTDSGMNRLGLKDGAELEKVLDRCLALGVDVGGVYSHFACTMPTNPKAMFAQYKKFCRMASVVRTAYPAALRHICNTSAALNCPAFHCDMVRVGLGLYGYCDKKTPSLFAGKSACASVIETKLVRQGESVGYDMAFTAERDTSVAVIDCGYGDGLPRNYARGGYVLTKYGKSVIIGNMCMDMCFIADAGSLRRGDKAVILGEWGGNSVKADDIAEICGTIPYEILCGLRNR